MDLKQAYHGLAYPMASLTPALSFTHPSLSLPPPSLPLSFFPYLCIYLFIRTLEQEGRVQCDY
uniref:Uncharacterized protein n=1 Tax=Anguilla anguilla TaxID=7936 RepID=A0A0E9RK85_ANGAN